MFLKYVTNLTTFLTTYLIENMEKAENIDKIFSAFIFY